MSLRLGALHDALLHPGDADLARKAAEEVASYQERMASLETKLAVLTWMVGTIIALALGNLWLSIAILQRVPR